MGFFDDSLFSLSFDLYVVNSESQPIPLHLNISMHILHTFPKVLTRSICLTVKGFFSW